MQAWLRLLIVWLVALALPVQALAAAGMMHCGTSHERMRLAQPAHGHGHDAAHGAAADHHHGPAAAHAVAHATADGGHAPQTAAPADLLKDLGQYKCSSCAACCAGYALPSAMPGLPQTEAAAEVFVATAVSVAPFATGGPDRPPRPVLA